MSSPTNTLRKSKHISRHKRNASEAGKIFQNLLKTEEETVTKQAKKRKKNRHQKFNSLRIPSKKMVDAEALTREERLSRLLHTPKPKIKLPIDGVLYDHFVVTGVDSYISSQPKILFQYPSTNIEIPGLANFCFPGGVNSHEIPESSCKSETISLLHSQQYLKKPENSFVFLFTNQESEVFYGICVHKEELYDEPPQYMDNIFEEAPLQNTTTRCYCLISKFPFFRLHFDFLYSLFAVEHLNRLENQAPSIIENKKEIEIFLSPQTPQRSKNRNQNKRDLLTRSDSGSVFCTQKLNECTLSNKSSPHIKKRVNIARRNKSDDHKNLIEVTKPKNNHPCIKTMESYRILDIPGKGCTVKFTPSQYLNPIYFTRPFFDEEEELFAEWGLPLTLSILSFPTLCTFISAILLEKKIVVYASSLRVLSALVFSFPPLIKPFSYHSVIIPMLPDNMDSFLEAPVPFVVGTTNEPLDIPSDVIILNATKDTISSKEKIPSLPKRLELMRKCASFVEELLNSFGNELPYSTTKLQNQLVDSICTVFETHFDSLFANFHNYTICDKSDPSTPISVFMKDSFLDDIDEIELPFIEPFIETQAFFEYSDQRLRRRDNVE